MSIVGKFYAAAVKRSYDEYEIDDGTESKKQSKPSLLDSFIPVYRSNTKQPVRVNERELECATSVGKSHQPCQRLLLISTLVTFLVSFLLR
jgi:hypothetical protein